MNCWTSCLGMWAEGRNHLTDPGKDSLQLLQIEELWGWVGERIATEAGRKFRKIFGICRATWEYGGLDACLFFLIYKFYWCIVDSQCYRCPARWFNYTNTRILIFFKFLFYFLTLQYCIGFAIYQNESTTGIHVVPIPNPPPSSLPIPSLWVVPVHQPKASSIVHRTWTGDLFHTWYYTCFNAILPNHPTLSLSHRIQKTVLYISVSFAVSYTFIFMVSCLVLVSGWQHRKI